MQLDVCWLYDDYEGGGNQVDDGEETIDLTSLIENSRDVVDQTVQSLSSTAWY
jgi:hypothetical protein